VIFSSGCRLRTGLCCLGDRPVGALQRLDQAAHPRRGDRQRAASRRVIQAQVTLAPSGRKPLQIPLLTTENVQVTELSLPRTQNREPTQVARVS